MLNVQQCFRGMVERDRDIEERRRDEMAEKLAVYKREVNSINPTITNQELKLLGGKNWKLKIWGGKNWKLQVANCETTARVMREEEARLEEVYNR